MGRAPCCDKASVKKGPWSPEEDLKLKEFIEKNGTGGNWIALPHKAGLKRCGKSCRLRWLNYLRPNIKHGEFSDEEDRIICNLFATIGSRWSIIAAQLPGRTDNDIKNYWNTKLKKKLMGLIPSSSSHHQLKKPPPATTQLPVLQYFSSSSSPTISFNGTSNISSSFSYNPTRRSSSSSTTFMGFLSEPISKLSSNHHHHHLLNNNNNSTSSSTTTSLFQTQENLLGPIQNYHNIFMFGSAGDQPSCSSSDGSCSNQISYGKDNINIHEYYDHQYGGGTKSVCGGTYKNGSSTDHDHDEKMDVLLEMNCNFYNEAVVLAEENQKFVLSSSINGGDHDHDHDGWRWSTTSSTNYDYQSRQNGFWGDYGRQNIIHDQQSTVGYGVVADDANDDQEVKQVNVNFLFSDDQNKTSQGGKEVMMYY